ncbi:MAG: flagellar biosynthesis anti-sigma factor FlgM [Nitrospirae bacterium]|nr:flagellar biosynthesis anti-sigma factor FlgM [Nitrospirota bacterium]MDA1304389.1 flagellar biosynthesis anti-sigma factor FlgM [Nitrospirota bacterium]
MAGPDKLQGLPQPPSHLSSSKTIPSESQIAKKASAPSPRTDSVNLSPQNTEYAQVLKRIDEFPDIRHDRVEHIRKALEAGTYDIDPHLVAERIIQEIVSENTPQKNPPNAPNTPKAS